jgi:arabinosaccharide transport system substrate-binding protein
MPLPSRLRALLALTSPAVWVLGLLALGSSVVVLSRPEPRHEGLALWTFARPHHEAYLPLLARWNGEHPDQAPANSHLLDFVALERRLLSAFLSGTPVADLVETERSIAARTFAGPLEDVGFVDLTERLRAEGLMEQINAPSFAPWTSRGRIFGIPHDVHPVLLAYRADLVEAAGIDLSRVETWDEFFAALRPLMADRDGDGRPDRYPLNFWPAHKGLVEVLLLQADGALFDAQDRLVLDSEINARVLATLATWCAGPARVTIEAPESSAGGNALRLEGVVLASLMPDWLAGTWKQDLPGLSGKVKLMPVPAWERGGRRTSVFGGTMLGLTRAGRDPEAAWRLAQRLYLDAETHAAFFRASSIIPPFKRSWAHPAFAEPDPFFSGQPLGLLYIDQAAHLPPRPSNPFNDLALSRATDVLVTLAARADRDQIADPTALLPDARALLAEAHRLVARQLERNAFHRPAP